MNSNKEVFIETTSIIDYIFKKKASEKIEAILHNYKKKTTAHYVKMEIKKGFLQYLVYLHGKVVRCESIDEVFEVIRRLSATPMRHRLGTVLEAIEEYFYSINTVTPSDITEKYRDIPIPRLQKTQCEIFLRSHIRRLFRNIDRAVDEIVNPMNCFVDIKPPREEGKIFNNKPCECPGSEIECNIKQFFRDNEEAFAKIRDTLKLLPQNQIDPETQQRISSLKEILRLLPYPNRKFSNKEPNVKDCWRCSDAILAVTASPDADVLNHNKKHYDPICETIGKKSISY